MMPFQLSHPLLLIILIPAGILLSIGFFKSLTQFSRQQRIASFVSRMGIVCLLTLALAGLNRQHLTREQFVLFLVDQSMSLGANAQHRSEEILTDSTQNKGSNFLAVLPFASKAGPVGSTNHSSWPSSSAIGQQPQSSRPTDTTDPDAISDVTVRFSGQQKSDFSEMSRMGTNIEAAIETARGYIPNGFVPHIVLLSDGNQTEGDALAAAARSGVPISTIPLPERSEPEVQITELTAPADVRQGEPFYLDVKITSNHPDQGLIEIFQGDFKVSSESRPLKKGVNRFQFPQSVDQDKMALFKVRVSALQKDTLLDNNTESALVNTTGKPRVMMIETEPEMIREMADALEDEGIQTEVRPPQGFPASLSELQNYEAVVISNVPAAMLTQQQMELIRSYVQESGGGFMMLGGEQSFGLGGYYKTPLEEILPVRSDFEKEKEKPSLGMALVIDRSGSMDGDKLEMARTAARSAVDLLGNRDQVAVVAFSDQTFVISEMQSAGNKGKISDEIASLQSGGGTNMYPAMETAFQMLNSTSAKLKHVILLTDGISNSGDFDSLARQMAAAKITITTVAIGGEGSTDNQLLESIARVGKGRFYLAEDPSQVPQIFARETMTASKSAIDEEPFVPQVIRATRALQEIDFESAPLLLGYVRTRPKPTSEVILATEKGDPLLSWWRYGLGMTAAFTSDAKSRWAAEWLTWPGYGKFWTQVVRQIMRQSDSKGMQVSLTRQGSKTFVSVDAFTDSGQFLNDADATLVAIDPSLQKRQFRLNQLAPGRYEGAAVTALPGAYNLEVIMKRDGSESKQQSRGLMVGYSDEMRIEPPNLALMRDLALTSGGEFDPDPLTLFADRNRTAVRSQPLWRWLMVWAAFLLVVDVALRRLDFSVLTARLRTRRAKENA